jgi:hypothetical protein
VGLWPHLSPLTGQKRPPILPGGRFLFVACGVWALRARPALHPGMPRADICPIQAINRTKMFHVKHFGTIQAKRIGSGLRRRRAAADGQLNDFWRPHETHGKGGRAKAGGDNQVAVSFHDMPVEQVESKVVGMH